MKIKTKYLDEPNASIRLAQYTNNRTAIQIFSPNGPEMTATVNIPDQPLEPDQVLIKNWTENEGILEALIDNNVITDTGLLISTGFVQANLCTLNDTSNWKE